MNGTYTVGGTSPDFQTIGEACDSLVSQGIDGPVVINIRDGIYVNDSIHLNSLVGPSATNTITIQSESMDSAAVTISHDNSQVVYFSDSTCGYITLRDLTLIQNSSDELLYLRNGLHHCEFNSLHIIHAVGGRMFYLHNSIPIPPSVSIKLMNSRFSVTSGVSSVDLIQIYSNSDPIDSILIQNNQFDLALSTYVNYPAEIYNASNVDIVNNSCRGPFSAGVFLEQVFGENRISGNEFYCYYDAAYAIDLYENAGNFEITNNIVRAGNGVFNYGTYGMSIANMTGVVNIHNNTIYADENGMNIHDCDSVLCYNNLIHVNLQGGSSPDAGVYNIDISNVYSDYNAFYSNVDFAQVSGITYADFASYVAATGYDQNSFVLVDPQFYDDSLDLHVCSDSLIGSGNPGILLMTDIDNEPRSASLPSIGADYFEPIEVDFSYTQNGYDVQFTDASVWGHDHTWDFGDGNSSTEQSPSHTYAANGTYDVTLTVSNGCETADTTITLGIAVGMDELNSDNLVLYPNPTTGRVQWNAARDYDQIVVMDAAGRTLEKLDGTSTQINLSHYKNGIYYIAFTSHATRIVRKVQLLHQN